MQKANRLSTTTFTPIKQSDILKKESDLNLSNSNKKSNYKT